jgi:hypothetical protein
MAAAARETMVVISSMRAASDGTVTWSCLDLALADESTRCITRALVK